ncbi:MAG: HlyD family efflux transporter periplasmic adaptor subunit [Planctomycetota bacterium]|nr:HlyD family efflux transporter periplasmic adaptor subunit [Planctomycetota bacterium]
MEFSKNLRWTLAWLALGAVVSADDTRLVSGTALTRLIEQADVPAETAGVLRRFVVREGARVSAGDVLVELDNMDATLALERARLELETAEKLAGSDARLKQVRTALSESEADVARANVELEGAKTKAESEIALRGAKLAAPVAEAEWQRAVNARRDIRDSVSQSELDQLKLALERARLEVQQAEQDRAIAALVVRAKVQEIVSFSATVERRRAELTQAEEERDLAQIARRLKANGVSAAERELDRRRLRTPISGVVVSTHRRQGEWVDVGERVVRVVRLDRLRVETFFKADDARQIEEGMAAHFELPEKGRPGKEFRGVVTFVSPEIDPVNGQVLVWAEIDNPGPRHGLKPGIRGILAVNTAERVVNSTEQP